MKDEDAMKAAAHIYFGVESIEVSVKTKKDPGLVIYDINWLQERYEQEERREIIRQAEFLKQKARALPMSAPA